MKSFKEFMEDAPANCAGGGAIAAIGIGPDGEPGVKKKKKDSSIVNPVMAGMIQR